MNLSIILVVVNSAAIFAIVIIAVVRLILLVNRFEKVSNMCLFLVVDLI